MAPLEGSGETMKLLLVEDNAELAHWVANLLRNENFTVDIVLDGERADLVLMTQRYDVVVLDIRLPGMDGTNVLARLRRRGDTVPVLMLTANGSTEDKVDCFDAGADDYVVKPFDARELVARIKGLIRRQSGAMSEHLTCGDLQYIADTREFRHNGQPLILRRREHTVLETLMLRKGKTVPKATLMETMFSLDDEPSADAVEIYIHRLRRHLYRSSAQIVTLRGLGYILRCKDAL
ncbi:DNA-binding response regulator, OmpR family, contains REC and winged-helix (wHTH) domain [Paraburkholderia terricola]|uniref:DNA-binding response regulator, OmpR family, contains REC and winged-helix (WHTH) domain n=3 Tax=Burkholderiaceae TaxID=119060 RepID=A0A1M6WR92_9BURK|nr:DNA-binding response regulator, OmpR family, contains REC and winged-helix (wHTH) domain [Paraburkholderia sediminicola]SHK96164.1 DNA-binding response regulator, OmpR family, contains REC and winged-helix (wHTH) domain [Paraburkholderia terricola]